MRTTGEIPSGPQALEGSSLDKAERTSFEEILIVGMKESEGAKVGGTEPESSKVEFCAKVSVKREALSEDLMAMLPSERKRGGKEETVKLR